MNLRREIGQRLVTARKAAGQSVEDVADATNLSASTIRRIESGDLMPSVTALCHLAWSLRLQTGDLLPVYDPDEGDVRTGDAAA